MVATEYPLPFREAMTRIERAGFPFTQNRWETWLEAGLIDKAERIPGSNQSGLSQPQWMRLGQLVVLDSRLFGRRSPEALAYWAATCGLDVPANLAAAHMVKSIKTFYSLLRRRIILQSGGRLDPRMIKERDAHRIANLAGKDIISIVPHIRNIAKRAIVEQAIRAVTYVIVCVTYGIEPPVSFAESIRSIGNALFEKSTAAVGSNFLRKMLSSEKGRLVDPKFGKNRLIDEIEETAKQQPTLILQACRDMGLLFASSVKGFGLDDSQRIDPNSTTGKARETARSVFAAWPMMSGHFLAMSLDDADNPFLAALRKDEGATFTEQIRRLDRINMWQTRRLETRP